MSSSTPSYSAEAEVSKAYLLREYNDIDIFIEDQDGQAMYLRILRHIVGSTVRIDNVYPLGSRSTVLAKCAQDQANRQRRRLYIIDGDFDCLLGNPAPSLRHLYRLSVYCIENLLLTEKGLLEIAQECEPKLTPKEVQQALDINKMLDHWVESLIPLFIVYAVSTQLGLGVETTGYTVLRLLDVEKEPEVVFSATLIGRRKSKLLREIVRSGRRDSAKKIFADLNRALSACTDQSGFISGKAYLLPLVWKYLSVRVQLKETHSRLKVRLAAHYNPERELGLRDVLRKALSDNEF